MNHGSSGDDRPPSGALSLRDDLDRAQGCVSAPGPTSELTVGAPKPTVSVVIPAKNEARNLGYVLGAIPDDVFEVVLVDGWSTDRTVQVARRLRPDIRVIRQTRRGKGNALMCGFHACRGEIIVMLDADGSADPTEISRFVEVLQDGVHFAKGTRFGPHGGSEDITGFRRWGNWALNHLVNLLHGTSFTDLCYGYNAFWSACLPYLKASEAGEEVLTQEHGRSGLLTHRRNKDQTKVRWGDGFEIETLLTVRAAALGFSIREVGSFESRRIHGTSNLHAVRDGWRVLRTIHREYQQAEQEDKPNLPAPWQTNEQVIDLRDGVSRAAPAPSGHANGDHASGDNSRPAGAERTP